MKHSVYPNFDVMQQEEHWDEHTRSIVRSRLIREHDYRFVSDVEAETLRFWCSLLVDDDRAEIMQYVLCHIDETLHSAKGEGQRKVGVPDERELVRKGLKAIEEAAMARHGKNFFHLDKENRKKLMDAVSCSSAEPPPIWLGIPQKELFAKLLSLTVEAYFSHPTVWSEIGYAGPAYPRGYIRTGIGQLDPWEARTTP